MYLVMFHKNWKSFLRNIAVTSLAEVWIETKDITKKSGDKMSLPLRKCGLKLAGKWGNGTARKSLPLRKCGLKQKNVWCD